MTRLRPKYHFTPIRGWMNDPHGLYHDGEQYHLFFQYVANSLKWDKTIAWGHATSPDLLTWQQVGNAIEPLSDEAGCWSGSMVLEAGQPHLFYTSPEISEWANGSVVLALPDVDKTTWIRTENNPLITRPSEMDLHDFRDPQIRKTASGWRLLMAAGKKSGIGAILEYESTDLRNWQLIGEIANSESGIGEPAPRSTVWECPQLIEIAGHWVLIVSAMDATGHLGVRYAVGEYDGQKFTPTYWGDFSNSGEIYATSIFFDKSGRAGVISWLKEINDTSPANSTWTSAQTIPAYLVLENHRVRLAPLADLDFPVITDSREVTATWQGSVHGNNWRLTIDGEQPWEISMEYGLLTVSGNHPKLIHVGESNEFQIVVDTDICEIYANKNEGQIAFRCPLNSVARISLQ